MKGVCRSRRIDPRYFLPRHEMWSASSHGRFTAGERASGSHCIGGWVGPTASLVDTQNSKIFLLRLEFRTPGSIGCPACSQALDSIRYPGSLKAFIKKLRGLSPRANYTDRATAKFVPTFADGGCHVVSVTNPYGRILGFLDRSRYFLFLVLLNCTHEAEWTPFQTHYFSENLVAPGIESGPLDLQPGTLTTRPQSYNTEDLY
jgi:hypothetical protein